MFDNFNDYSNRVELGKRGQCRKYINGICLFWCFKKSSYVLDCTIKWMVLILQSDWMSHAQSCLQLQTPKIVCNLLKNNNNNNRISFAKSLQNDFPLTVLFLAFVLAIILCHKLWGTCFIYLSVTFSFSSYSCSISYKQLPYSTSLLDHFTFSYESEQLSGPSLWHVCVNDVSHV